ADVARHLKERVQRRIRQDRGGLGGRGRAARDGPGGGSAALRAFRFPRGDDRFHSDLFPALPGRDIVRRQIEGERAALAGTAYELDLAAKQVGDLPADRET